MLAYRSCLGLLRLSKAYPPTRVDAACARALEATAFNNKSVRAILEKGLNAVAFDEPAINSPWFMRISGALPITPTGS